MKVVEQLIQYFRERGELTATDIEVLTARGFVKREPVAEDESTGREEDTSVIEEGSLDGCQSRLEGAAGRKGKKPRTAQGKVVRRSFRRWWEAHIAVKQQERAQAQRTAVRDRG